MDNEIKEFQKEIKNLHKLYKEIDDLDSNYRNLIKSHFIRSLF